MEHGVLFGRQAWKGAKVMMPRVKRLFEKDIFFFFLALSWAEKRGKLMTLWKYRIQYRVSLSDPLVLL